MYNLRGCWFNGDKNKSNINNDYVWENRETNKIPTSSNWINDGNFENTKGVFRFNKSYDEIYKIDDNKSNLGNKITDIKPLGIQFSLHADMKDILISKKIKGLFFVRQTRIPTILCQGYSVGIDRAGYYPMIHNGKEYEVESFKTTDGVLVTEFANRLLKTESSQSTGLLCVDAYINKQIQSMFDTSEFKLEKVFKNNISRKDRHYHANISEINKGEQSFSNLIYIDPEIPQKTYNNYSFSTKAGMQEDLKYCGYFETKETTKDDASLVRGIFTSFVGTTVSLEDNCIYNIRTKNYDESFCKEYFEIRMNDKSPFYAISPRYNINPKQHHTDFVFMNVKSSYIPLPTVFRGDCFTNTVTTRMHRNFTSSSVPINDTIIDNQTWKDNFKGMRYTTDWNKINKADVDAVPIGSWITYKCLSNFNLSLRCIDDFQIEEQSIMGNPRGFYPKSGMSTNSSNKIPESNLMNDGYNSLMGVKRNFTFDIVPYLKDDFDTRIMFSNIQVDGAFKNSYKVFQGLSYEDIDRQYGSITKILPWGVNLFCVFEHGLAIIPVNEKALLQTTEGANIHMYGSGVLQKQVVLISDSIGSIWKDSIVKTPLGIYGVDTENHKIWRYSDSKKLEIISDFNMQRYLHDNIELKELEKYTILGTRNVKSHYNAFKGDVMFTYYNKDKIWNICYNENMGKWITRYSWTPYMSENIDHSMFSFDLLRTRIFGLLNTNNNRTKEHQDVSVVYSNNKFGLIDNNDAIGLSLSMNNLFTYYNLDKLVLKGYYWDRNTSRVKYDVLTSWDKTGLGDSTSSIKTQ